jgi:hypothetical protein
MNDQIIKLASIKHEGLYEIIKKYLRCISEFRSVNWQYPEYLALKYLVLFDPDVTGINNSKCVEEVQETISSALVEYITTETNSFVPEKFSSLLLQLPNIKLIGVDIKHLLMSLDADRFNGKLLEGCLLGEMLYGPSNIMS